MMHKQELSLVVTLVHSLWLLGLRFDLYLGYMCIEIEESEFLKT